MQNFAFSTAGPTTCIRGSTKHSSGFAFNLSLSDFLNSSKSCACCNLIFSAEKWILLVAIARRSPKRVPIWLAPGFRTAFTGSSMQLGTALMLKVLPLFFSSLILSFLSLGGSMDKLILIIKILVTEQKVKFYTAVCRVCERIERYIKTHRK